MRITTSGTKSDHQVTRVIDESMIRYYEHQHMTYREEASRKTQNIRSNESARLSPSHALTMGFQTDALILDKGFQPWHTAFDDDDYVTIHPESISTASLDRLTGNYTMEEDVFFDELESVGLERGYSAHGSGENKWHVVSMQEDRVDEDRKRRHLDFAMEASMTYGPAMKKLKQRQV